MFILCSALSVSAICNINSNNINNNSNVIQTRFLVTKSMIFSSSFHAYKFLWENVEKGMNSNNILSVFKPLECEG